MLILHHRRRDKGESVGIIQRARAAGNLARAQRQIARGPHSLVQCDDVDAPQLALGLDAPCVAGVGGGLGARPVGGMAAALAAVLEQPVRQRVGCAPRLAAFIAGEAVCLVLQIRVAGEENNPNVSSGVSMARSSSVKQFWAKSPQR